MNDNEAIQRANQSNYAGCETWTNGGIQTTDNIQYWTTGNIQYWPYQPTVYPSVYPQVVTVYTNALPTECADDVHVFPCAKCGECKCGKARIAKGKK